MEDKPRDIDHLVFVVHGIGQKQDTGKIIRNTTWYKIIIILMQYVTQYFYKIIFLSTNNLTVSEIAWIGLSRSTFQILNTE